MLTRLIVDAYRVTIGIIDKVAANDGLPLAKRETQAIITVDTTQKAADEWVVAALKTMGFSTAEAKAAATIPEVMAETELDDQVRLALQQFAPKLTA